MKESFKKQVEDLEQDWATNASGFINQKGNNERKFQEAGRRS